MNNIMDISVDAKVHCLDGDAGHVTCVIINPITDDITHIALYDRQLLGMERLVPITLVAQSTPEKIMLNCKRADLHKYEPFIGVDYDFMEEELANGYADAAYWSLGEPDDMGVYSEAMTMASYEEVPPGEIVIHRGSEVHATDGVVGHVHEFIANPDNGHITHIVLSRGHLWGRQDISIPMGSVKEIIDGDVRLKIDKKAISELPKIKVKR